MPLALVSLVVDDYDSAIDFFVRTLGFIVAEDRPSSTTDGRPERWVVVQPAGGGTGILLAQADGAEQEAVIGCQFAGRVGLFLRVGDLDATLDRIVEAGCEIVRPVRSEPYGLVCVFRDPWGNLWDLLGQVQRDPVHATVPGARVLVIGLDPSRVPGPWDPQPVIEAIEVGRAEFVEHGVGAEFCLVGLDGSDDVGAVVTAALRARPWECVVVGGGVRHQLDLLEQILNLVHRHAPQAAIAFNDTPEGTYEAAARWLETPR